MNLQTSILESLLDSYQQSVDSPDLLTISDAQLESLVELDSGFEAQRVWENQQLPPEVPQPTQPSLRPGQIWSIPDQIVLPAGLRSPNASPIETGSLRLFVLLEIGQHHLGRFQEILLCPLTELLEMASHEDLILPESENPFAEKILLEIWNSTPSLSFVLDQCWGEISEKALQQALAAYQGQAHDGLRGGTPVGPDSVIHRFQGQEKNQMACLAAPMHALNALKTSCAQALIHISPKGLNGPPEGILSPFLPTRLTQNQSAVFAASAGSEVTAPQASSKERLQLGEDLILEFWQEGDNLEFFCANSEQTAYSGLLIGYTHMDGSLKLLETDLWGTAFLALAELSKGDTLLSFTVPEGPEEWFYPISN
ncbi:MAG: hypothetical protein IV090_02990 [Candidatus Sericytochromatia bacterium]|nr:hypothetical protein [Candidatus Sericytochromatia bacterium]